MDLKKDMAMKSGLKGLLVILFLVLSVSLIPSQSAEAASKKSKALKAYNTFLTNKAKTEKGREFALAYIDNDSVPELYYDGVLYKYKNGSLKKITSSPLNAFRGYYKKKGIVTEIYGHYSTGMMIEDTSIYYFKLSGTKLKQLSLYKHTAKQYDIHDKLISTTKTYSPSSKSKFNKKLKSYVGSTKETKFSGKNVHKNTAKNRKKYLK